MPRHPLSTTVKFQKLHPEVELPTYQSAGASGMDLRAWLPDGKIGIPPHERKIVPLGFKMELEPGYSFFVSTTWLGPSVEAFRLLDDGTLEIMIRNWASTTIILEHNTTVATLHIIPVVRISSKEKV